MSKNQVCVVVGASSGLGFAVAEEMAKRGYDLVLSSRNPEEAAETLRARHDVRIEIVPGSVADLAVAAALAETASGLGGASALLLNHGGPPVKPFMSITDEDWSQSFEMIVNGPLRVLRALVPQMQEAESGRVVAVSSFTVKSPYAGIGLSNGLRAALVNALKTAALELGPERIMLNALAPGYVETGRIREWNDSYAKQRNIGVEDVREQTLATVPLRRYGTPEGYARMAAFLLSDDNDYISGQQILYDGALVTAN